ncbi:hypothetical protein GRI34_08215 [Erythrobacter aquimaris]|uniref:Uncharacterized protein n=1 Tax=Qipengyuania aquimaris TaxID=255984 RepID=A0A6I4TPC0_9SPHN|nr:hypothetical protein [Qipengyuania aquimaris]MXO96398.1 hypothetical protein [Qipengyuania aquimaris]
MAEGKTPVFLNRIAAHLREQNWFALAAEFLIVVSGVFLGLQAANWKEERQEREDEAKILARLQAETATLLGVVRQEREELQTRADLYTQAQGVIFTSAVRRQLTEKECSVVAASHIYRREADQLPILEELLSTGRFDRLKDEGIKSQLRRYILFRDRPRANHEERTNELFRLYSRHPDAIQIAALPRGADTELDWGYMKNPDVRFAPQCNVEEMRSNRQFLNELFDNMGRNGHVLLGYEEREALLAELQRRLDELPSS